MVIYCLNNYVDYKIDDYIYIKKFNGVLDNYLKKISFSVCVCLYIFQIQTQHVNLYEAYTLINYHLS